MFSLAPEYNHKLKQIKTPGGRNLTAVTASARTIYVNVSTGALILKDWATATASKLTQSGALTDADGTPWDGTSKPWQNGKPVTTALTDQVLLASWPKTPAACDGEGGTFDVMKAIRENLNPKAKLRDWALVAGFPTTNAANVKGAYEDPVLLQKRLRHHPD